MRVTVFISLLAGVVVFLCGTAEAGWFFKDDAADDDLDRDSDRMKRDADFRTDDDSFDDLRFRDKRHNHSPEHHEDESKSSSSEEGESHQHEERRKRSVAKYEKGDPHLWNADQPIKYKFSGKMKKDKKMKQLFKDAADYIMERTCLTFEQMGKGDKDKDYLDIMQGAKCVSFYGKQGGAQQFMLAGKGIESCKSILGVSHEILHALGIEHEMKRPDRDDYIKVITKNTNNPKQFQKDKHVFILSQFQANSAMQYDRWYNAKEGKQTMEAVDANKNYWLERTVKTYGLPTFHDIKGVNILYGCIDKCAAKNKKSPCQNEGYRAGKGCKCLCPSGFEGDKCQKITYMKICGSKHVIQDKSGEIKTSVFTEDLSSRKMQSEKCAWVIASKESETVLVSFHSYFFTEDFDKGSKNYVEVREDGESYHGDRLFGLKDLSKDKMAFAVAGPNAYIEMGIDNTNGFGVGFRAKFQVMKTSDFEKCNKKNNAKRFLCYNGGSLSTGDCKCKCMKGYKGKQCEDFENKNCKNKLCENHGHLQVNKKDCPCECPYSHTKTQIQGDQCQYFGFCYQRLDKGLLSGIKKDPVEDSPMCKGINACDNKLFLMVQCPVKCGTPCECVDFADTMKPGTCNKMKKPMCTNPKSEKQAALMCGKKCDKCPVGSG